MGDKTFDKINNVIVIIFLKGLGGLAITAEFYPRILQRFFWSEKQVDCEVDYWIVLLGFLMVTGHKHYDRMITSVLNAFSFRFGNRAKNTEG